MPQFAFLVDSYRTERLKTLGVWSQVPDARMTSRPEARARTPLEHMVHQCLSEDAWMKSMLGIATGLPALPADETRLSFLEHYAACSQARLLALETKDDAWFGGIAPFFDVPRTRSWIIVRRLTHSAHHRGQLLANLRAWEELLYSTYGPTADTGGLPKDGARVIYRYASIDELLEQEVAGGARPPLVPVRAAVTERPDRNDPSTAAATTFPDVRAFFPALNDTIYMNTATMAVGCAPARDAYVRAVDAWAAGRFDWLEAERAGETARGVFAAIVGATAEDVAIVPSMSAGAGLVAANLPPASRGENVVVAGNEFSSNYFPWLLLRERGYDVRAVSSDADGPPVEAYAKTADGGTRLIAVSAVHSPTGYRTDLGALRQVAAKSGAWLFVDAAQAAGAVPLDVMRDQVDFVAAAAHKFLLGSRGMGYLYVRRGLRDQILPVFPGWKAGRTPTESFYGPTMDLSPTAQKLDGSLAWFAALADAASIGLFQCFGIAAILDRNAALSRRLHDALTGQVPGFRAFPEAHRSTIVSVPVKDTDATIARLRQAGVIASVRAGRVRLSVHFYNREDEIDRVVELLAGASS